jgi:hypothetical protein
VLLGELYRNLLMAGGAVLVVTWILIANLLTSILVFLCVIFTVVSMHTVLLSSKKATIVHDCWKK